MEFTGKFLNIKKDWQTDQFQITFSMDDPGAVNEIYKIQDCKKLKIKAVQYRKKRSLDANGLLWHCLGMMAAALRADKWDVYLQMLKRYGHYTYILAKPNAVEGVKEQWRESEVIGEINVNGQKSVQMLCYFGSSTYNTKEFSVLLDGVISEMKEMGLDVPTPRDMERALEMWEQMNGKKTT